MKYFTKVVERFWQSCLLHWFKTIEDFSFADVSFIKIFLRKWRVTFFEVEIVGLLWLCLVYCLGNVVRLLFSIRLDWLDWKAFKHCLLFSSKRKLFVKLFFFPYLSPFLPVVCSHRCATLFSVFSDQIFNTSTANWRLQ